MFEKDIVRNDGTVITLVTSVAASRDEEMFFTQSVQVGDVIGVGKNIGWVKDGDRAILDYTVDVNDENVAYKNTEKDKVVCLNAITKYHDSDFFVPANRNRPFDQYVYRVGDIDTASMLIGVIRDGEIIPNFPYIILAYKKLNTMHVANKAGIYQMDFEEKVVERYVVAVNERSKLKVGDVVVVDADSLFDRVADGKMVSVVYEHDILATSRKNILHSL